MWYLNSCLTTILDYPEKLFSTTSAFKLNKSKAKTSKFEITNIKHIYNINHNLQYINKLKFYTKCILVCLMHSLS